MPHPSRCSADAAEQAGREDALTSRATSLIRGLCVLGLLALAASYAHGFAPLGRAPHVGQSLLFLVLAGAAPLALGALGLRLLRGPLGRVLTLTLALSCLLFVLFGQPGFATAWHLFGWRLPATLVSLSGLFSALLLFPSLLARLGRLPAPLPAVGLTAALIGVFLLSTEITGTDTRLPLNLSPWAALPLVGLHICGYALAGLHLAAGAAVLLSGAGLSTLGAVLFATGIGAATGLVVPVGTPAVTVLALAGLGTAYALQRMHAGEAAQLPLAITRLAAGLLLGGFILLSQQAAHAYQAHAQDQAAARVIAALESYRADHQTYPDALDELIPSYLDRIPRPHIGPFRQAGERFLYTSFGDSYALEFASVQWVQCTYTPPVVYDDDEEYALDEPGWETTPDVAAGSVDDAEGLAGDWPEGSWTCEKTPPRLF
ncbi:MAG: hypothetical protein ACE5FG_05160 [Myxococcota bacterium]